MKLKYGKGREVTEVTSTRLVQGSTDFNKLFADDVPEYNPETGLGRLDVKGQVQSKDENGNLLYVQVPKTDKKTGDIVTEQVRRHNEDGTEASDLEGNPIFDTEAVMVDDKDQPIMEEKLFGRFVFAETTATGPSGDVSVRVVYAYKADAKEANMATGIELVDGKYEVKTTLRTDGFSFRAGEVEDAKNAQIAFDTFIAPKANVGNMRALYSNNNPVQSEYGGAFASGYISVEVIGAEKKKGTLILVPKLVPSAKDPEKMVLPSDKAKRTYLLYYVDKVIEKSTSLITKNNFKDYEAKQVKRIVQKTNPETKKQETFAIEFVDDKVPAIEALENSVNIGDRIQTASSLTIRNQYVTSIEASQDPFKVVGLDISHKDKDAEDGKSHDCLLVYKHHTVKDNAALYVVEGKTTAEMVELKLTPDEFMALVTKDKFGGVEYTETEDGIIKVGDKEVGEVGKVSAFGVKDIYNKKGDSIAVIWPYEQSDFSFGWGSVGLGQDKKYTLNDSTEDLAEALNAFHPGLGTSQVKGREKYSKRTAKRHLVTTLLAAGTAAAVGLGVGLSLANENKVKTLEGTTITTVNKNEENAKKSALKNLPDETSKAVEHGKTVGKTENAGETLLRWVSAGPNAKPELDKSGIAAVLSANWNDANTYVQQEGMSYTYYDSGKDVTVTLTQNDLEEYRKTIKDEFYREYTAATQIGYYQQVGAQVAEEAFKNGAADLVWKDGKATPIMPEGEFDKSIVDAYKKGFEDRVAELNKNGAVAGAAADNTSAKLEAAKDAATSIAGKDANVVSVKDGVAYIKTEDDSTLLTVPVSENLDNLSKDIKAAEKNKEVEVYKKASDMFATVLPDADLTEYETVFVKTKTKGNEALIYKVGAITSYTAEYIEQDGTDFTEMTGNTVTRRGDIDLATAAVLSIKGVDAAIDYTKSENQGYKVSRNENDTRRVADGYGFGL